MSKRKAYRPRVVRNPLDRIAFLTPLTDAERTDIATRAHIHYEAMRTGTANIKNAESMGAMVNIIGVVAFHQTKQGNGLVQQICLDAYNALCRATAHNQRTGRWMLDGLGQKALAAALELFEQCLEGLTAEQYLNAIAVADRMERDEASNPLSEAA